MKRRLLGLIVLAVSLLLMVKVSTAEGILAFEELKYTINVGSSLSKKPVAQGIDGKLTYEWLSANNEIATVSANGQVKGVSNGETTITCKGTAKNGEAYEASYIVEVIVPIKKIKSDTSEITLTSKMWGGQTVTEEEKPFFTYTPSITIEPENASNKVLEWSSSDPFVAEVDSAGVITAGSKVGTATITGKATDGSGKSVKIKVTIPRCFLSLTNYKFTELGENVSFAQKFTLGNGMWVTGYKLTGKCIEIVEQHQNGDSFSDGVTWYTVKPVKAGSGSIQFVCNNKVVGTVKFTVDHSAVYDNVSFPAKKITTFLKNVDGNIGVKTNIKSKIVRIDEDRNNTKNVYGIVKEGNETYYVDFCLVEPIRFSVGDTVTIYGEFSGVTEYKTDTGLTYMCLVFNNGHYEYSDIVKAK